MPTRNSVCILLFMRSETEITLLEAVVRRLAVLTVVVLAVSLGCMAQDKAELYGGYSFLRTGTGLVSGSSVNANGWDFAVTGKFNRYFGVKTEINGDYASDILGTGSKGNVHNIMFGPTVSYSVGRITPFAHALYGVSHLDGNSISGQNSFAMAYGGGVDVNFAKRLAVRLGQFDYVRTQFNSSSQNHFRYSSGIVLRF